MTTTPDEARDADESTHQSTHEDTAPASISTEDSDITPAEREHQEIDANAFRGERQVLRSPRVVTSTRMKPLLRVVEPHR